MAATMPPERSRDTSGLRVHRACRPCIRLKAKCVPLEGSNHAICQRCHRLGKECTTPAPVSRKRQRNKSSRVAHLEEKLDALTNLLSAARVAGEGSTQAMPAIPTPSASSVSEPLPPADASPCGHPDHPSNPSKTLYPAPASVDAQQMAEKHFRTRLTPVLEEKLFTDFRAKMSPGFPFVTFPPAATARTVRAEQPFLFRNCVSAACYADLQLQRQMGEEIMAYLAEQVLIRGEKSLDLLQGILVLVAWFHYHNHHNPQVVNLLHLATALAVDLGLTRPPPKQQGPLAGTAVDPRTLLHGKAFREGARTADEKRAVLGIFFLARKMASCLGHLDLAPWSPQLKKYCEALAAAQEYPSDAIVVQYAQIYCLAGRYGPHGGLTSQGRVPIRTYVRLFEEDVEKFRRAMPDELKHDDMVQMDLQSVLIGLYESVHLMECDAPIEKVEALQACIDRIDDFFTHFEAMPISRILSLPYSTWIDLVMHLLTIGKLSFLQGAGWDVHFVRDSPMNFVAVADRIITRLETVSRQYLGDLQTPNPVSARFSIYAEKMRLTKRWYENTLKVEADTLPVSATDPPAGLPPVDMPWESFAEYFDDTFLWTEFMGDWTNNVQF